MVDVVCFWNPPKSNRISGCKSVQEKSANVPEVFTFEYKTYSKF